MHVLQVAQPAPKNGLKLEVLWQIGASTIRKHASQKIAEKPGQ